MKTLSREGIQRMVDGAGGSSVSGGGISSGDLAGLATQVWVNQNYLSIDFFSSLFKAYGPAETEGDPDVEIVPNDTESTISNIKAMFGFWTEQYISALGQGSGGGGGGATSLSDLLDVEFSGTPSDGQVLKYNGTTHKWYNGNDEGLTSLPWSSITGKPTTLSGYGITDAYTKTEADGRYLKLSGGTMSNTNVVTNMNADLLDGLNGADYLSRHNGDNDYDTTPGQKVITVSTGSTIVSDGTYGSLIQWGNSNKTPGTVDNNTWYNQLIGMTNDRLYFRTRTNGGEWTTAKKIAFISDFSSWALASTKPSYTFSEITGTIVANQLPDLSGTYAAAGRVTALEGYFTDGVANNAARLSTVSKTAWGQTYWTANGVPDSVSGSIEAGNSGGYIRGFDRIELNNHGTLSGYGGFIDFHFNGSSSDYTSRIIEDASGTLSVNSVAMWSGYVKATRFYLSNSVYFQLDANGDVQLVGAGLWTNSFISALGQGSGGGGGGASALTDLTDVEFSGTPSDGQVLKYNGTTHKWYNGNDEGLTSLPWSSITGKPTTLSGYGITDAYTKTEADGRYLKLSGGTMSNTNVVTNMNADLLDGLNGADYLSRHNVDNDYDTTPGQKIITVSTGSTIVSENQWGSLIQWGNSNKTPGTADSGTWYNQLIGMTNNCLYFRTRTNGGEWTTVKKIAFISDFSSWALASTKPSYAFSELTSHPTTLSGYGITDAYISSGTIYLGGNSITPLTSFTETDPTVPAWAKASTKPSYAFSELTSHPTTLSGYGITDAKIASGVITLGSNSITPLTASDHPSRSYTFTSNVEYTAKWHRLGNYKTAGNASNFAIILYTGSGYNANASQNSFARIVVKDGWQQTPAATNSVGVTLERFGNFDSSHEIKAVVVATSDREGALWVYLPWQYADGNYTISGVYDTWTHNSGYTDDTTTEPTSNQRDTGYFDIVYNKTYPQFSNLRLRNGTDNYGSYLYFGDGSNAFICEPTDDSLQYKVGANKAHVFTVGNSNKAEVNSSGLTVNGNLTMAGYIDGATNIELKPSTNSAGNGGYIDFHYNQSSSDYTSRIIEDASGRLYLVASNGIRIGDCVITWDATNNAMKVQKADGTAANLYATGGVSALGLSSGSGGSIGNLRVTGTLNIGSSYTSLYCDSNNRLYVDAPRICFGSTLYMGSNNIRTESGNIYTEEGNIYLGGGYIYLDSSRYIYLDGSTLKFYDGSTAKTIYTY